MARGRLISKSLGSSRKFHQLLETAGTIGEFCQVLFPLVVANTDDFGRMPGDAFTVKHVVLPSSPRLEQDFEAALDAMRSVKLIERYEVDGQQYLQVVKFETHQPNLHKRTKSAIPEIPEVLENTGDSGNDGKDRPNLIESNLREVKGTELPPAPVPFRKGFNGGVLAGSLHRDHLEHIECSPNFAWCMVEQVHTKLANKLKPKYGDDYGKASEVLRKWYPTVWQSLPTDFTMGDIFRFWQPRFDAAFASKDPAAPVNGKRDPVSTVPSAAATSEYLRKQREMA